MAIGENLLGAYLRDRRAKLDPGAFGISPTRRRTPGLRREEVAQRANVSVTWYTWLEQGRGGAPSAEVLNRIARALLLTDVEREHLFLLAQGRPPEARYQASEGITPTLQRVLDSLAFSPALVVRAFTRDILAWNHAATAVLVDYAALPAKQRNVLRLLFCNATVRARQPDWESVARFAVATFRADAARAGAALAIEIRTLVEELCAESHEFAALWSEHDVCSHGEGIKTINHPTVGLLSLEYSAFSVDGRPDLNLVIYTPETEADAASVRELVTAYS
ncbi:helix-turn-helix transcriptional regulator [Cupriavidus consociatus]|uniref:helix-turn-helix transcriptional regulator n=1 Tax=Cupriavidus consociatus TaxID=2821357 RepID=UPI001AE11825|nr:MULTISPECIES: helix-turn-helix transcriptional regulator [unclassified Cupriavidus]MBP0623102.1 helix-turn-helix domain-containing protein [Cupriavidus sp. LEh25]MDK2659793.1 helix-turn-helix transcriptional regulator [Cupriavidus sp. LEh21]